MDEIKRVQFKTGLQTRLAKLIYFFNRRVKGVKPVYNVKYLPDGKRRHTLDIMRAEGEDLPCVVYFHGGGWCAYDKSIFRSTTKMLASYGAVVFNCNFSLAPEYGFKQMVEDAESAINFVKQNARKYGADPDRIILAGDSAGAHILSLYLNKLALSDRAESKRFIGCAFFYGVYDLKTLKDVDFKNKSAYVNSVTPEDMPDRENYVREYSPINYLSPSLPPTLICAGMIDGLTKTQSLAYAQALKDLGVRVESIIFPVEERKAQHRFITFTRNPVAKIAFNAFGRFIKTL